MDLVGIISRSARSCIQRFPTPAAFATALAVYAICIILAEPKADQLIGSIFYFLSVGFVLSLSLALWSEERAVTNKELAIHFVAYLVLLADSFYLYHINFGEGGHGYETFLMHASAILALTLTVFFLSFCRERNDIPSWNFALRVIASGVICAAIGLILWGGLNLLLTSLNWLFSINLGWKWYSITGVLVAGYLPALLFLGRIPGGEEKHDAQPLRSGFLAGVFRYLFLPLEALYIVVLYIYALQILIRWELPNGQVSWLVIASMVGLVAIEFGLYPTRHADNRPSDHSVARWLPLVLTPLLLLMTVGIVRRFSDYGITIARLYLATLNVWFYLVCLGLFLTRARRIHWIPISFAALFLLTSALPLNYTSLTRHALMNEVERALTQAGADIPLDAAHYASLMQKLPQEEQSRISSKLIYLENTFRSKTIEPLVTQKEGPIFFREFIHVEVDEVVAVDTMVTYYADSGQLTHLHIPEGYSELYGNVKCSDFPIELRQDTMEVPVKSDEVSDTILVSLRKLKALNKQMDNLVPLPTKSSSNLFYLQYFYLNTTSKDDDSTVTPNLSIEGYLLKKTKD
ncbi:MAG: DUF4153 domain-containing protein [Bacteroidaceae bacterium]|nr:DUF4153 domain-containing protein [Bacteroidaceae bacterium]